MLETPARPQLVPRDYYQVLGVTRDATADQIKRAYKQLVHQWHPDRHLTNKEEKARRFMEAHEAYIVLTDADSRALYDYTHESPPSPKPSPPRDLPLPPDTLTPNTLTPGPTQSEVPVPTSPSAIRLPLSPTHSQRPITPAPGLPSTHQSLDTNLAGPSDLDQTILGGTGGETATATPKAPNKEVPVESPTPAPAPDPNDTPASTTPIDDPSRPPDEPMSASNPSKSPTNDLKSPTDDSKSPTDNIRSPTDGIKSPSDDPESPTDSEKTPNIRTPSDIPSTPVNASADPDKISKEDPGDTSPVDAASPANEKPSDPPVANAVTEKDAKGDNGDVPATSKDTGATEDADAKKPDEEQATVQQPSPPPAESNPDPGIQGSNAVSQTSAYSAKPDDAPAPVPNANQASGPPVGGEQDTSDLDAILNASPLPPVNDDAAAAAARPPPKKRESSRGRSDVEKALGTVFNNIGSRFDSTMTRSLSPAGKSTPEHDDMRDAGDDDDFDDDGATTSFPLPDDPSTPGKTKTEPITPTTPAGTTPAGELKAEDAPVGDAPTGSIPPGDSSTGDAPLSGGPPLTGDTNDGVPSDEPPSSDAAAGQPHVPAADELIPPPPPVEKPADSPVDPPPPAPSDPVPAAPISTLPVDSSTVTPANSGTATPAVPITPADTGTPAEPTPEPTPRPLDRHGQLPAFHATPAPSMTTEATPRIPPIPPVHDSVPQTPTPSAPLTDTSNLNTPKSLGRARSFSALQRDDRPSGTGKRSTSAGPPPSQPASPTPVRTSVPIDTPQPKAPTKDPKSGVSPPPIPPITTANGLVPAEWHYPLHVSLETLYSGAKLRYRVTRYLLSGQTQESYVDIEVKPGWRKGTKIRFAGLGNERNPPLSPQDVIFIVDEIPHPKFRREGSNLFTTVDISLLDALSESSHVIPGLDGKDITVDIDFAGGIIRPGDVSRVVGKGMPIRRNSQVVGAGDLTIKWNVIFPDRLTSKQRSFIRMARDEDQDDRTT